MNDAHMPPRCPSCGATLRVVRLECPVCQTDVTGSFDLCPVCRLDAENRTLFDAFMRARGNVKQVQRELGLSYPTVRQKIVEMFGAMGHGPRPPEPRNVLQRVRDGEIDVDTAEALLRGDIPE